MRTTSLSFASLRALLFALVVLTLAAFASQRAMAMELLSGLELRELVTGNTVSKEMVDGATYRVFFDPSGAARAGDAQGTWIVSRDRLCAEFDGDEPSCLGASVVGGEILWVSQHGELEGTGQVIEGNPFQF